MAASDWPAVITPDFSLIRAELILWTKARCRGRDFSRRILLHTGHAACLELRRGGEGGAVSEGVGSKESGGVARHLRIILGSDLSKL